METKEIQKLIDFISKSDLDEVNIETSELKLKIKRNTEVKQIMASPNNPQMISVAAPQITETPALPAAPVADKSVAPTADSNLLTITSPMIGTFYRSGGPEKPSFIEVGDDIQSGKVVCIIEAMKLFNEIESEISGKIVKVLVEDATPVEFDQPLFLVEPN
ncbi:MAG: acetyl-CoA carboxylase biotin carboxyl carrier protein [Spirosomaceae bacterium]|nr:acetyl-CoA carboxylase biotin carboxyl carrier protein [Spirosomataceae bacterium]